MTRLGQGTVTRNIAKILRKNGWTIGYICVPNTPHVGVVPIPTSVSGVGAQRYPDVVAFNDSITLLIEVEPVLNLNVSLDIHLRFTEMITALENPTVWERWRRHVQLEAGIVLPPSFSPLCKLVVCEEVSTFDNLITAALRNHGIRVVSFADYSPST